MQKLIEVQIQNEAGVAVFSRSARHIAEEIGFDELNCAEVEIAASEIAMNAIQHGGGGIGIINLKKNGKILNLSVEDEGPGIRHIKNAMRDGFSSSQGSLGLGLGAAKRLTDKIFISNKKKGGLKVVVEKNKPLDAFELQYGFCSMADARYTVNGDKFIIKEFGADSVLVGVIDGLGQGEGAYQASNAVAKYLLSYPSKSLDTLILGSDQLLRQNKLAGAAIGLLHLKPRVYHYSGIGDTFALGNDKEKEYLLGSKPGMLGNYQLPTPKVFKENYSCNCVFVLCTDGIHEHFTLEDLPTELDAQALAQYIMSTYRRSRGDATVVVIKRFK